MLTQEAVWEMPPFLGWYVGAENIGQLIDTQCPGGVNDMPMVATSANGQPAFGLYMRTEDGDFEPFHLQVLDIEGDRVRHVAAFFDTNLFRRFGLPDRLPADHAPRDGTVTTALASAVELLERSLGYTRVALVGVTEARARGPDPVPGLDAARPAGPHGRLAGRLHRGRRRKRRADAAPARRRGSWSCSRRPAPCSGCGAGSGPPGVRVGGVDLATDLLVATAALEITVHGWDVAQATGAGAPIPDDLARHLLPVAHQVVSDDDRGIRFAAALPEPVRGARPT